MEVYVTVFRHKDDRESQFVQVNATYEGHKKFVESLNKDLFIIEGVGSSEVED